MKRIVEIVPFDEHDLVTFYSVRFGDDQTEFEKFQEEFDNETYLDQIDIVYGAYDNIGKNGAHERSFRYAGKVSDNLCTFPGHLIDCDLRVFVLRLSENIVILGNGYKKSGVSNSYNDIPVAVSHADLLRKIDKVLRARIQSGDTIIYNGQLMGNLTFKI